MRHTLFTRARKNDQKKTKQTKDSNIQQCLTAVLLCLDDTVHTDSAL